jgi:ABC-type bacteriocin/lantibiotic exporter with double-glycine peptidase domain
MRFHWPSLEQLLEDLGRTQTATGRKNESSDPVNTIKFEAALSLKNITFKYPNAAAPTLKGIELAVSAGTFVGIAGASGVGKTTLIDIILGLLTPAEGLSAQRRPRPVTGQF